MTDEACFLVFVYYNAFAIRTPFAIRTHNIHIDSSCIGNIRQIPGVGSVAMADDGLDGIDFQIQLEEYSVKEVLANIVKAMCNFYGVSRPQIEGLFQNYIRSEVAKI